MRYLVNQVEVLAQQLLAAAEANPAITFASRAQALAYYRTAARSELARKARAGREEREWAEQEEVLRHRAEQERRIEALAGLSFEEWWQGWQPDQPSGPIIPRENYRSCNDADGRQGRVAPDEKTRCVL